MKRFFLLLLCTLGVAAFAGHATAATTGNSVASSNPIANEVVAVAPTQIQMVFQNAVTADDVARMGLSLACDKALVSLGPAQLATDGVSVTAPLTQIPPNGKCNVSWALPDGSKGTFSFRTEIAAAVTTTTLGPDGEVPITVAPVTTPTDAVTTPPARLGGPIGLLRLVGYLFVSALVGGLLFMLLVWPEGSHNATAIRYIRLSGIGAVLTQLSLVVFTTAQVTNTGIVSSLNPTDWFELFNTSQGRTLFLRFLVVIVIAVLALNPERVIDPEFQVPSLIMIAVLIATYGFDRAGGRLYIVGVIIAIVHMALVIAWTGGVFMISRVILSKSGDEDLLDALRSWSRLATTLTVGIIGTGLFQVGRLDGWSLINSGHGRLLLLKIIAVIFLIFVELALRKFIMQRLSKVTALSMRAILTMRKAATIQMSATVVILAMSSWLISMRPPNVVPQQAQKQSAYAINRDLIGDDGFHVTLSITPGDVGNNQALIELFAPKRIQNFTIKFIPSNPVANGYVLYVPITRPGGALIGADLGLNLKSPGEWKVELTGATTTGELTPLTTTFIIADGITVTTEPTGQTMDGPTSSTTTTTVAATG